MQLLFEEWSCYNDVPTHPSDEDFGIFELVSKTNSCRPRCCTVLPTSHLQQMFEAFTQALSMRPALQTLRETDSSSKTTTACVVMTL